MTTSLVKHANGYALVLDPALLEQLSATPKTTFQVTCDGQSLVLTPIREVTPDEKFERALAMLHTRFGNAMRKLAE